MGDKPFSQALLDSHLKKSQKQLAADPNDLKAQVDLGILYFLMGTEHYAESLNAFNAAWQAGAFDKRIFYYSGILYENLSLLEEAQKQYDRFLRHEPKDRETRLRLARLLFKKGDWEQAVVQYQKFIEQNPEDLTSLINLGLSYHKKYELKSQEKEMARGRKLKNEEIKPDEEADRDQAIAYLERAAKLEPNLPQGLYSILANLYFEKKEWEKSAAACGFELKKNPEDTPTLKILSSVYEKMNQNEKALEIVSKLLEKDPKNRTLKGKVSSLKSQIKKKPA